MRSNATRIDFQSDPRLGYMYVCLAALFFAVSGSCAKFLFQQGVTAFQLIQLRTSIAFLGLLFWLCIRRPYYIKISPKDALYFACLGVFGIGAAQFFYLFAISKINVAAAILLHYTGPVFVALYSAVVQKRHPGGLSIAAIVGSLVGCYLVVGAYNIELLTFNKAGIIGGFLAAAGFATYSLLSEYGMRKYPSWTVLLYGLFFAAIIWHILYAPFSAFLHQYSVVEWFWILFIGIGGTIIPFGLYFEGIKRIKPTHASITATLEPIAAGVLAALFLGEYLSVLQMLGGLVVMTSIAILQLQYRQTS